MRIDRRTFLKNTLQGGVALGLAVAGMGPTLADGSGGGEEGEPHIREYRLLGRTGLKISDIGAGTYGMASLPLLSYAVDLGINIIDTSPTYGFEGKAEQVVGEAVKHRRRDVVQSQSGPALPATARSECSNPCMQAFTGYRPTTWIASSSTRFTSRAV